ncbi:MAG: hypothetical protein K6E49_05235 [Lachnospiraceae bacterium]|nr:hypothetical protein [Lachnospiraceae bacterium]
MNPQSMMQLLGAIGTFRSSHPKFASFLELMLKSGIPEDTVIEISVTRPGEETVTANMKVTKSDLELFSALRDLRP